MDITTIFDVACENKCYSSLFTGKGKQKKIQKLRLGGNANIVNTHGTD